MTEAKPCGCGYLNPQSGIAVCPKCGDRPNAAPKASEALKEECVEGCLCTCGDILAVHMVTRAPFEPDPQGHAIACPKYIDLLHPNGRCTCGGEGRCEWCERIGNSYADDWVNTKPAPAPVDVGPGSAWQRKAEENARRLASFSPEASEAPEQHGPDDVRLGRPTVCSSYCEYWLTWEHSEDCTPAPAPKASEAPKVDEPRCLPECERNCWSGQDKHAYGCPVAALFYFDLKEPAPAPVSEPDPLFGIDARKWAQEFMRIWSGRWAEVDEGLMIGWFANAIMRGYDEGQHRLRKELQSANPTPAIAPVSDKGPEVEPAEAEADKSTLRILRAQLAAEKARADRAEARVRELEDLVLEAACIGRSGHTCVCGAGRPCEEAGRILANHKKEERNG